MDSTAHGLLVLLRHHLLHLDRKQPAQQAISAQQPRYTSLSPVRQASIKKTLVKMFASHAQSSSTAQLQE